MDSTGSLEDRIRDVFQLYHRDVYQFLLYFTGDRGHAEDLTQEVFLQLLKALPRFDGRSHMKTWLLSIARHVAVDRYRRKKLSMFFTDQLIKRVPSKEGLPEAELESKEVRKDLDDAMQKLKPQYRAVVILRGIKEFSTKETAEILGCSETKVKVDYHRALKLLQEQLRTSVEGGWPDEYAK